MSTVKYGDSKIVGISILDKNGGRTDHVLKNPITTTTMTDITEKPKLFTSDSKAIVDMLFDAGMFKDSVTRDHMNTLENLIQFTLESRFEAKIRAEKLFESIVKNKNA